VNSRVSTAELGDCDQVLGQLPFAKGEEEDACQTAAPTENENTQLAPSEESLYKSADGRVATEAAWLRAKDHLRKIKIVLTRTGLLMEGFGQPTTS